MKLGERIFELRKKSGLSQEEVAEKLGVSRQTVSKWELNQAMPELSKAGKLCELFGTSYEYLMGKGMPNGGDSTIESLSDGIDWTRAWAKKYPILMEYQEKEEILKYQSRIIAVCREMQDEYNLSDLDMILVAKDMIYKEYLKMKKK